MILILLTLLCLTRMLYKRNGISPSLLVVATFLLSSIFSFLYLVMNRNGVYSYSYISMIYYISTLVVFLIPLIRTPGFESSFAFPQALTKYLAYFLIAGGFVSLYGSIQSFSLAEIVGNWNEIRAEYYNTWGDFEKATSLVERIEVNVSPILYLCPPLAFYFFSRKSRTLGVLLTIASLTTLVESIKIAERQDLVLWLIDYIMAYFMFRNSLDRAVKKIFLSVSMFFGGMIVILIATITIARFGEGKELIYSLYGYFAVQPFNAAYFLENLSDQALGGRLNFPFFVGGGLITEINDHIRAAVFLNSFASIVGSYYKDFGYYTIFVASIVSLLFNIIITVAQKKKSFLAFYFYCLYFNIMYAGVFYNKYTSPIMFRIVLFGAITIFLYEYIRRKLIIR